MRVLDKWDLAIIVVDGIHLTLLSGLLIGMVYLFFKEILKEEYE